MTTVAARPPRSIPTVQANPALLRQDDMVYPDDLQPDDLIHPDITWTGDGPPPFRVIAKQLVATNDGIVGWRIDLDGHGVLLVRHGVKVRTQRRPNHQLLDPDAADQLAENYQEPRYG